MNDIDRSRAAMRRRIDELNRRHCRTARELQSVMTGIARLHAETWRSEIVLAVLAAFENLVRRTPVDTGRARAGWTLSNTGTAYVPPKGVYPQYQGANIGAAINSALSDHVSGQLSQSDIIWVYNNVEYVLALDAGWSRHQAGNFISLFLQELKDQLEGLARRAD